MSLVRWRRAQAAQGGTKASPAPMRARMPAGTLTAASKATLPTLTMRNSVPAGMVMPSPAAVFDPAGRSVRYHEDLWQRFVGAAIALFFADLLIRRVRFFDRKRTAKPSGLGLGAVLRLGQPTASRRSD